MLNSRKTIGIAVVVIVVAAFAVVYLFFSMGEKGGTQQVWWIASDPHLGNLFDNVDSLRVAIEDVNNLGIADHAAILGDLVNNLGGYADNFIQLMGNLKVEKWYYVLGNHDFDRGTRENVFPVFYDGIDVLGIRFVFISTEAGYSGTSYVYSGVMGEKQFDWLWTELYSHKNQPIFMFSHQPPSSWNKWSDLGSLIQSENVDVKVWFYGHDHEWEINENVQPYNFMEICDNSLDWANNYAGVFLFLQREGDTVNVTIKFRNHLDHEWISVPTVDGRMIENMSFSVKVA